jgi:hypothetical protein
MLIGTHRKAEMLQAVRTSSVRFSEEIAWMMYWVEKIAPMLAIVHAMIVVTLIVPFQVK